MTNVCFYFQVNLYKRLEAKVVQHKAAQANMNINRKFATTDYEVKK